MDITLHTIPIKDLVEGFVDNNEEGVVGYGGKLNIRPPYQREFVYNDKQRNAVIDSIFKSFPLNTMYWVKNNQGGFELLDGQQRTVSICSYYKKEYSIKLNGSTRNFGNLTKEQQEHFLNYQLQIYICENGTEEERLDWFKVINIAGEELTEQEMRNAVYTGPWITSAKKRFSKNNCVAFGLGNKYMTGKPIRQEYLETVLSWISNGYNKIEEYMSLHQHDENSDVEWQYFQTVISWVKTLFPEKHYRKEMKGLPWGFFYNKYKDNKYSSTSLEEKVSRLMADRDVTNKKGIYEYLLAGETKEAERLLQIRAFDDDIKREVYERQKGICPECVRHKREKTHYEIDEMEADHITPWSQGGKTTSENCQMLCKDCNRRKSNH